MKILILGTGCPRCQTTERNVYNACAELGLDADIGHEYDVKEFPKYGVFLTPAVVVDGKIVVAGRVPSSEELKKLFQSLQSAS